MQHVRARGENKVTESFDELVFQVSNETAIAN